MTNENTTFEMKLSDLSTSPLSKIQADFNGNLFTAKGGVPTPPAVEFDYTTGTDFTITLKNSKGQKTTPITLVINPIEGSTNYETTATPVPNEWDVQINEQENVVKCNYLPNTTSSFQIPFVIDENIVSIGIQIVGTTEIPEEELRTA